MKNWLIGAPVLGWMTGALRASAQERTARRELRLYERLARQFRIVLPSNEESLARVRETVARRRAGRPIPKPGTLRIFLACAATNWEKVLPGALAPFGEVVVFDWAERGFDQGHPEWVHLRDKMNRVLMEHFIRANQASSIDLVIGYLSGHVVSTDLLDRMRAAGAVVVNCCLDDTLWFRGGVVGGRWRGPAAIAGHVDCNLTSAPASRLKYAAHGGDSVFFPEAATYDVAANEPCNFEYDVSFVGGKYGPRARFVETLRKRGLRVSCFGNGWEGGVVTGEKMRAIFARSRVNLGFSGIGHSLRLMNLKGRDFEVPMAGGLYLTQNNPELRLVYRVGAEIVTYESCNDAYRKIRHLLDNPVLADRIRRAGSARALKDHTYEVRWAGLLQAIGLL